jgi:hypothetical protein
MVRVRVGARAYVERLGGLERLGATTLCDLGGSLHLLSTAVAKLLAAAVFAGVAQPPVACRARRCARAAHTAQRGLTLEPIVVDDDGRAQKRHDQDIIDNDDRRREDANDCVCV